MCVPHVHFTSSSKYGYQLGPSKVFSYLLINLSYNFFHNLILELISAIIILWFSKYTITIQETISLPL